jgi:hypothetical protein
MNKVVARYVDGRMLKGFTSDFNPSKGLRFWWSIRQTRACEPRYQQQRTSNGGGFHGALSAMVSNTMLDAAPPDVHQPARIGSDRSGAGSGRSAPTGG